MQATEAWNTADRQPATSPPVIMLPMFVSATAPGLTRAPATAAAVVPLTHMAGLAPALLTSGQTLIATGHDLAHASIVARGVLPLAAGVLLPVAAATLLAVLARPRAEAAAPAG